ncbi:MAG: NUDIX domain-containing protein [Tissierellia bacterium]|nr:NUDIX domain-containing protein [Tissierellia bacterium]
MSLRGPALSAEEERKIYSRSFQDLGYLKPRSAALMEGEYYRVAGVFTFCGGKLLITQRATGKSYAHRWEITMGSVVGEEGFLEGALRELHEEVGISARGEELTFLGIRKEEHRFSALYLLERREVEIRLQQEEVENYRWVRLEELEALLESGIFAPPMARRIRWYWEDLLPYFA